MYIYSYISDISYCHKKLNSFNGTMFEEDIFLCLMQINLHSYICKIHYLKNISNHKNTSHKRRMYVFGSVEKPTLKWALARRF